MKTCLIVMDTSYLDELYAVPEKSSKAVNTEARKRFALAVRQKARFFVPLPCLFELANHIAHISDGNRRKNLADSLVKTIEQCVSNCEPWIITPYDMIEALPKLCRAFADEYVAQGIGLTDTYIIQEARRLKRIYNKPPYRVHIWTKDHALKACEPDLEL
ncbi:MAG: hypothetical protein HQK55_13295 [Deltaproteobacteria bacterium]|nr:hypothetical protein [Deltaproteobacteria bacterium]